MPGKKFTENIKKTSIPGLLLIEKPTFHDNRGFFREVLRLNELEQASGIKFRFKQWNHSKSLPKVIRALHCEVHNKIVYPISGNMFSALADVRVESKTFGKVETFYFKEPNYKALFIPAGVANSICVIGNKPVHYIYLIDDYYQAEKMKGIAWDDPDLAVNWPIKNPILSGRDKNNPTLRQLFPKKFKIQKK